MALGTVSIVHRTVGHIRKIIATCVASSTDGSFPATVLPAFEGRIVDVLVNPGSPAPQTNYDLTLPDANGFDALQGLGMNLSATVTTKVPVVYAATAIQPVVSLLDVLTLTLAGNNVNSAQTVVEITYALGG